MDTGVSKVRCDVPAGIPSRGSMTGQACTAAVQEQQQRSQLQHTKLMELIRQQQQVLQDSEAELPAVGYTGVAA